MQVNGRNLQNGRAKASTISTNVYNIYDEEPCVVTMYYVYKNKYAATYFLIYAAYDRYANVTRQFLW